MDHNGALPGQEVEIEQPQVSVEQVKEQTAPDAATMQSLLDEQGLSLDFPKQGEIRKGIIATIRENEILVSIGTKSEGVISGRELEQIPTEERSEFDVGKEIPVYVIAPEDANGNVVLSYIRAREERDWDEVERLLETDQSYEGEVIGYNKGGLIVPVGQLRGFVPASQISLLRRSTTTGDSPDQRYAKMVGDNISVRVIEVDRSRRRLILSERQALQETRESLKDRLLEELSEGDIRTGRVTSLADFGAFVNIEGADGLVHLSEISWDRIQHPNEILEVGQEVEVKVISIDHERKRIGLSIRQLQDDPWMKKIGDLKEGQLVEGTITHLTKFGAFASLGEDMEGLIHVSELSEQRIAHPKEAVHEGDVLTLRIIKIDPERRRIGLSLRKVDSPAYADLDWKMALSDEVDASRAEEEIAPEEAEDTTAAEVIEDLQPDEVKPTPEEAEDTTAPEVIEDLQPDEVEPAPEEAEDTTAAEVVEDLQPDEVEPAETEETSQPESVEEDSPPAE